MINITLLKQSIKDNLLFWCIITGIQSFCLVAMVGIGGSIAMTAQAFYVLLPGILFGIYTIITSNKLIVNQVDKGSMAYILSTPIKRSTVAITQMCFMILSLLLMFSIMSISHIGAAIYAAGSISAADVGTILELNLGLFALSLAFSGICFLCSSLFNLSKYATGLGGGFVGIMLLFSFLGLFGGNLGQLANFSIAQLFDITSILQGTSVFIWKLAILAIGGIIAYTAGIALFTKRDLPL